jgi:transcriptional regulator with XRE-family HTH domain
MSLDTTLRLLTKATGLTVADLATAIPKAGVNTVSAWLKGDKVPGKEQIDALARTFGVPAGALLGELASTLDPARTKGEHELLAAYRRLNTRQQGARDALPSRIGRDEQVVQNPQARGAHRREHRIKLGEPDGRVVAFGDEQDGFIALQARLQPVAGAAQVRRLRVELAVRVEERSDPVEIVIAGATDGEVHWRVPCRHHPALV